VFDKFGVDHPVNLIYVTLVQRDKDRLLVRKVLVDRANAYARNFGNPVCCDSTKALTLQHSYNCIEYGIDRLPRATLLRLAAM